MSEVDGMDEVDSALALSGNPVHIVHDSLLFFPV
jgi:hypothetical protein